MLLSFSSTRNRPSQKKDQSIFFVLWPKKKCHGYTENKSIFFHQYTIIITAINDCARAVIGSNRKDRVPIRDLLQKAGLPSLNRLVIEQIAMECWKSMNYECNGSKTPIGEILCPPTNRERKMTRSTASNCLPPPTKFKTVTFAWNAYRIWNSFPPLRSALTLTGARRAAKELAESSPL